ncbi:uncharacterized protein LOC131151555 [Malania oleifera]|uniref:uncharacterized protein LOC131151555 n=1 Tax=Malania oleifera TaxID=397392 RepID=UPI0025AECA0C|nr:uncharacterized protein LOC131151555 [Malania oleifera]
MAEHPRSPSSDFYHILGISKGASILDVSKAYKSLARKWHPDKNPFNASEAKAKFTAINEAYKAINGKKQQEKSMNSEEPTTSEGSHSHRHSLDDGFPSRRSFLSKSSSRRSSTPTPLMRSMSRRSTPSSPITDHDHFPDSFSKTTSTRRSTTPSPTTMAPTTATDFSAPKSLSKSASRRVGATPIVFSQSTAPKKPQPIEKKLECTLEELCHGCVKKIKITRDVMTNTGTIAREEEILIIKVKPGWKKGTKITFEGKGDEKPGSLPADITFLIDEKRHPLFKREGDDLELGVEIPLVKALTGCIISVPLLGGERMSLAFDDIIYPGYEKIIQGQGMPKSKERAGVRGDLRLKFLVNFPMDLSDDQRSDICSILQDSSS